MARIITGIIIVLVFVTLLLSAEILLRRDSVASHPAHGLFAPGTSPELVEQIEHDLHGSHELSYNSGSHWNPALTATGMGGGGQGQAVTLTWSIIPDGTTMSSQGAWDNGGAACNSDLIAQMDARYGAGNWIPQIAAALDAWGTATGNTFVYEPNDDGAPWPNSAGQLGVRGDMRIGGCTIDGNNSTLAYNFFPSNGDMKVDSPDAFYDQPNALNDRFFNTMAHEQGHGLGLFHVCPTNQTKLMEPFASTIFLGPQHDDIRGGQRLYGDPNEAGSGNDSAVTATSLGALSNETVQISTVSIDDNSDEDWFAFSVGADTQIDVTLAPSGFSYEDADQISSCQPGPTINSAEIHDLQFEILNSNGSTVIQSVNATGLGQTETISGVALGGSGTKYIRVLGDSTDDIQLYDLTLTIEPLSSTIPVIDVVPDSVDVVLQPNAQTTRALLVNNVGGQSLTWTFGEDTLLLTPDGATGPTSAETQSTLAPPVLLPDPIDPTLLPQPTVSKQPFRSRPSAPVLAAYQPSMQAIQADIPFQIDDNSYEWVLGAGQAVWVNRFTPNSADYPFTLDEVSILFSNNGVTAGELFDLYLYEDLDGDGDPTTGTTVLQAYVDVPVSVADGVTFSNYTLPTPIDYDLEGDLLIGVYTTTAGTDSSEYPITLDATTPQGRSWIGGNPALPSGWVTVQAGFGSVDGNFLIRGLGRSVDATCALPSNVGWLDATPTSGTTAPDDSSGVTLSFDATGLTDGVYEELICIDSNDPTNPRTEITVQLTVDSGCSAVASAASVTPTIVSSDFQMGWNAVANATGYSVYASASPYFTANASSYDPTAPVGSGGSWIFTDEDVLISAESRFYITRTHGCTSNLDDRAVGFFEFAIQPGN